MLEREDQLAVAARDVRHEIETWRIDFFDEYAAEIISSFSEEDRNNFV